MCQANPFEVGQWDVNGSLALNVDVDADAGDGGTDVGQKIVCVTMYVRQSDGTCDVCLCGVDPGNMSGVAMPTTT